MALVKCVECHKEISSDAKFSPHCGKKILHVRQTQNQPLVVAYRSLLSLLFLHIRFTINFQGKNLQA